MTKINVHTSPYRNYRKLESTHEGEYKFQIIVDETDLHITIPAIQNTQECIDFCLKTVVAIRAEIKSFVSLYPHFQTSLNPIQVPSHASTTIKAMCEASEYAKVGPFATVAGTIAQITAQKIALWLEEQHSCKQEEPEKNENIEEKNNKEKQSDREKKEYTQKHDCEIKQSYGTDVLVENGGDTFLISTKNRVIAILANPSENEEIGLQIYAKDCPLSICSSSATIGHSLSLGHGDLALVQAKNAALADAMATAYGNMLKSSKDIQKVIERCQKDALIRIKNNPFNEESQDLGGVEAVFLQCDGQIGVWGNMELVAINRK